MRTLTMNRFDGDKDSLITHCILISSRLAYYGTLIVQTRIRRRPPLALPLALPISRRFALPTSANPRCIRLLTNITTTQTQALSNTGIRIHTHIGVDVSAGLEGGGDNGRDGGNGRGGGGEGKG